MGGDAALLEVSPAAEPTATLVGVPSRLSRPVVSGVVAGAVALAGAGAFPIVELVHTIVQRSQVAAPTGTYAVVFADARHAWRLQQLRAESSHLGTLSADAPDRVHYRPIPDQARRLRWRSTMTGAPCCAPWMTATGWSWTPPAGTVLSPGRPPSTFPGPSTAERIRSRTRRSGHEYAERVTSRVGVDP